MFFVGLLFLLFCSLSPTLRGTGLLFHPFEVQPGIKRIEGFWAGAGIAARGYDHWLP